jgi:peptidyl-prolyl cis-trans isomerase D
MPPGLIESVKEIGFGETTGPIQLPVGFAFFRRVELEQRAGSHILITYSGAMRANPAISRTKEEAETEANRVLQMVKDDPSKFEELAAEHSDGPTGPMGGNLGTWFKGSMVPEFDEALNTLDEGEIAEAPVETDFGFHIIRRDTIED